MKSRCAGRQRALSREPRRDSVQAIPPVAVRHLHHASDGTPVGSATGIRQRMLFPRRDRCASTPGLHDRTPSGSWGTCGLDGSIGTKRPRDIAPFSAFVFGPEAAGPYHESAQHREAARGVSKVAISLRRDERKACASRKALRSSWTFEPAKPPTPGFTEDSPRPKIEYRGLANWDNPRSLFPVH